MATVGLAVAFVSDLKVVPCQHPAPAGTLAFAGMKSMSVVTEGFGTWIEACTWCKHMHVVFAHGCQQWWHEQWS
jgi:aspartate/tyrosine/aromatic aminotransferase